MKKLISIFLICITGLLSAQDLPRTITNRHTLAGWVRNGTFTFTNKTLTTPALSGLITHTNTSAATSGTVRSYLLTQTHTGDGAAILEAMRVVINSAVQTGSWSNAIVGRIAYSGATGDAGGGLAAAMCSEVVLPAISSPAGSYFAHDFEFEAPTSYVANTGSGFNVAFLRFGVYGTTVASFEDESYFMHVSTDFTDASGNMWYDNTMRIQIETTDWFIPLSDAEGEYSSAYLIDISNATDATSLTAASIATDGGLAVTKQLFLGDDLDMSVSGTGVYDITLKTNMADALSITDGTDIIVFETTTGTPVVTITPITTITGQLTTNAGIDLGTSQAIVATTAMTVGDGTQTVNVNSSDWNIDATGIITGIGNITSDGSIDQTISTTVAGGEKGQYAYVSHITNALTGELIGMHGNARVNTIDSPAGTVMGGKFQAGNMDVGTDLSVVRGIYTEIVNKVPVGATTWTYARGNEINLDLNQGSAGNVNTITNADGLYILFNLPATDTYATVTTGYGIRVVNEAVGGTGQALDAAIYIDDVSMSGGIYGWDYGVDMNGASGFTTADIRFQDGTVLVSGYDGSPNGALSATKGSLCIDTTNADLYINTNGTTAWSALKN